MSIRIEATRIPPHLAKYFKVSLCHSCYVCHSIEIMRECRRVLRPDGVMFWNIGDSYSGSGNGSNDYRPAGASISKNDDKYQGQKPPKDTTLKPKDLCLIPFRVALAAQSDGWWVRSAIVWNKPNPMPESVTDRPTDAYEFIFLFTKSARYYWDAEATKEEATGFDGRKDTTYKGGPKDMACGQHERWKRKNDDTGYGGDGTGFQDHSGYSNMENPYVRNMRNVWTFPTQSYKEAHFATFPEELPERCIKAATPEYGCCDKCGRPYERILEHQAGEHNPNASIDQRTRSNTMSGGTESTTIGSGKQGSNITLGWQQGCKCENSKPVPSTCLDPFGGSGTTAWVSKKLNRKAVLYEISEDYCKLALNRNRQSVML